MRNNSLGIVGEKHEVNKMNDLMFINTIDNAQIDL